jgi:hypothetical protein
MPKYPHQPSTNLVGNYQEPLLIIEINVLSSNKAKLEKHQFNLNKAVSSKAPCRSIEKTTIVYIRFNQTYLIIQYGSKFHVIFAELNNEQWVN